MAEGWKNYEGIAEMQSIAKMSRSGRPAKYAASRIASSCDGIIRAAEQLKMAAQAIKRAEQEVGLDFDDIEQLTRYLSQINQITRNLDYIA
jgi:predicted transposase YdaD